MDTEADQPIAVKCIKREPEPDDDFQAISPCSPFLSVHKRLVSRRYVSSKHFPSSHAALKPLFGAEMVKDNSNAAYVGTFSNWKNVIIDLSCSTNRLTFPSLLRLMTTKDCGMSDQVLTQCIDGLMSYKKPCHLYALYSAMKALLAFHPRSSEAVNCHILKNLSKNRSDSVEQIRVYLVLDFIVSYAELELRHYPKVRCRGRELGKMLSFDSPLVRRLIQETENGSGDVLTLALLQRAVAAVAVSNRYTDPLVPKLYRLYRHVRHVGDRQQLLATIAEPRLRLKVAETVLSASCDSDILRPSDQCLAADNVYALCSLLTTWLQARRSSVVIGDTSDQIEEYLAVVLTYVESTLHVQKGLLLFCKILVCDGSFA